MLTPRKLKQFREIAQQMLNDVETEEDLEAFVSILDDIDRQLKSEISDDEEDDESSPDFVVEEDT